MDDCINCITHINCNPWENMVEGVFDTNELHLVPDTSYRTGIRLVRVLRLLAGYDTYWTGNGQEENGWLPRLQTR